MEFYILKKRPHLGPYSITRLDELLQEEAITGEDLYWYLGMDSWVPLSQFPGYIPPPASPPPPPDYILRTVPSPVATEPPDEENVSTARLRKDEVRPLPAIEPAHTKEVSTAQIRKDDLRPLPAVEPAHTKEVSTAIIRKDEVRPLPAVEPAQTKEVSTAIIRKDEMRPLPAVEPAHTKEASTAKIRKDEMRPLPPAKPSQPKTVPAPRLWKDEPHPIARTEPSLPKSAPAPRFWTASRAAIIGLLFLTLASAGYLLSRFYADKPAKPAVSLPRKIASVGDALRFVYGTWTYTGTERGAPGKTTLWEKLVVKPNGMIDMYSAFPGDADWGTPTAEHYKIVTGKNADTGERVFAIQVAAYDMKIVLTSRGLREIKADRDVEFSRGDRFPFSK